ncbi:MAG: hypothetical protein R3330_11420, partial [Saprospiraceae bacterium]|nr:hypothetical protein [Saprospiraceae bacterium]
DTSQGGYGIPPAVGYDYFQGPIVDLDGDGVATDTLGVTAFMYFINGVAPPLRDPANGEEIYEVMQGRWTDGTPMEEGGDGFMTGGPVTRFAFPGDPVENEYWSEVNSDGMGTPTDAGGDRRFVMSTGPFTLESGVPQDIVYGIVFAQGSDRFTSISALRGASQLAQTAYNIDFELPLPPPAPAACDPNSANPAQLPGSGSCFEAVEQDGQVTLVWGYPTTSSNYLGQFDVEDRLLSGLGVPDSTYTFEGFNIYRYPNSGFPTESRELVAVIDVDNGVTTVVDEVFDPAIGGLVPFIAARGTDSGLRYFYDVPGLNNYTDYFYGISAYAYNEFSTPKVIESQAVNLTVRPSMVTAGNGGSHTNAEVGDIVVSERVSGSGAADVTVRVVDPTRIVNATYRVSFYEVDDDGEPLTTYNITRDGTNILNGGDIFAATGRAPSVDGDNFIVDGLEFFGKDFTIEGDLDENPDFSGDGQGIVESAYAGSEDVCTGASDDYGCQNYDGRNTVWHDSNSNGDYYVTAGGGTGEIDRMQRYVETLSPDDMEV